MSGTTTITAQIQIPTDSYVGTSGLHTMMPPGGLANISLPMMTAGEIAANPSVVQSRDQAMSALIAVIAMSNQAYAVAFSGVTVTVTAAQN